MPKLLQCLQSKELDLLKITAELWSVDLHAPDVRTARKDLAGKMLHQEMVNEVLATLGQDALDCLESLIQCDLKMPWTQFTHRFGELREMGAARRAREKPQLHPQSTTEVLWYRSLICRSFLETDIGPKEFAFVPEDLSNLLPFKPSTAALIFGRPAKAEDYQYLHLSNFWLVDHASTTLAAMRLHYKEADLYSLSAEWKLPVQFLVNLCETAGLCTAEHLPIADATEAFLALDHNQANAKLFKAWRNSQSFNDLHYCPGIVVERSVQNQPKRTRENVLELISRLKAGVWWHINSFVASVKTNAPNFQRDAGEFETWFIQEEHSGEFLRGISHWDKVEGRYLHYMITGPLWWFGFVDLASADKDGNIQSFRLSSHAAQLFSGHVSAIKFPAQNTLTIDSKLSIFVPRYFPRTIRYQISRFCEWEGIKKELYHYRISASSLQRAYDQSLSARQLLTLLEKYSSGPLPPPALAVLSQWEKHGRQARLQKELILRVNNPEIIEALKKSRAARFLGDSLGPTAVLIKPGAAKQVAEALASLGYLADILIEE